MEKYNVYTTQDFLDDLDFVQHAKYPDRLTSRQLTDWRASEPTNAAAYDEAMFYMRGMLGLQRLQPTDAFADALYEDINEDIQSRQRRRVQRLRFRWLSGVAAAAVLLLSGVFWYFTSMITIATGNGEMATILLPDSSTVQLNANSSIAYRRAWSWLGNREVYSTGEALFHVKHLNADTTRIKEGERFFAHSSDLVVEVLGTKFNIKNRDNSIAVSLIEGRIALRHKDRPNEMQILSPGQMIHYMDGTFQQPSQEPERVAQATSWAEKNLVAENLSVGELINEFRYIYGREIVIRDSSLLAKRIDGRISLKSQESVIYSLANILQADVQMEKDTVYLTPKNE
ncbi:FecR family protein [Sphingobacterium bambusae]|uniref:FecR family protein n=1 Tax=Sphingobacterium bambusae TaxID=662858 RepID=A0ABW6BIW3_9SPHI|nr:FecR domain-containing protein [Sphingobacterium bambusae]WPL47573.1 FecR domain-containing protein [Sphingobacterium bambusae]